MSRGQHRPPDHTKGDESTIGGYAAVHDRPAAFQGTDGFSYSVELMAEETDEPERPWAGFILFVKWARVGAQNPEGHLETDYLVRGSSQAEALRQLGDTPLDEVKAFLDRLIDQHSTGPTTSWWDAMRDEGARP